MSHRNVVGAVLAAAAALAGAAAGARPLHAQDAAPAAEPSPAEVRSALLERLKPVVFGADGVESLHVEILLNPTRERVVLDVRGAAAYDLFVASTKDGLPHMAGRDGTTLAYLPGESRGRVRLLPGIASLLVALEERGFRFGLAVTGAPEDGVGRNVDVRIDPGSILRHAAADVRVERGTGDRYRLSASSARGSRLTLDVDPSARFPVTAFSVTAAGQPEAGVEVTRLAVNEPPRERIVGIPSVDALRAHFQVEDLRDATTDAALVIALGTQLEATGAHMRLIRLAESNDPEAKAAVARDRAERERLAELIRAVAR